MTETGDPDVERHRERVACEAEAGGCMEVAEALAELREEESEAD